MKRIDLIKRGIRNLRRNTSRSILTILALSIGAITLVLTFGVGNALEDTINAQLEDFNSLVLTVTLTADRGEEQTGVPAYNPDEKIIYGYEGRDGGGEIQLMTNEQIEELRSAPGVTRVWPSYAVSLEYIALAETDKAFIVNNTQEQSYNEIDILSGTYPEEWTDSDAILSKSYVDSFGMSADELVGKEVRIGFFDADGQIVEKTFSITAIKEDGDGFGQGMRPDTIGTVMLSIDSIAHIYDAQQKTSGDYNTFSSASVLIASPDDETRAREGIKALNDKFAISSISDITETITSVLDTLTLGLAGFSGIALLAAAFGIINTQLMSVFERTKEIGLLKALGMPNKKVRRLFSYEAIIIGIIGAIVGSAVAFGIQEFVNSAFRAKLEEYGFPNGIINLSAQDVLMVVVGLGLLSWIAGVIPARKAQKLDPIQALREE